ncbi:MAG: chemotaxis protein CheW [Cyanobacteriota bacterium]|nr:chemotaxis protein CheW [Cyanobacteriota bacterium]
MTIQSSLQGTENFLSFSISPNVNAMLPARQLVEIISIAPHDIVPIPQMSTAIVGVVPWQGEVLWTVDLSYWMGFEPLFNSSLSSTTYSILKVKTQGKSLGFLTYQVSKFICCETQNNQAITAADFNNLPKSILQHPARKDCIKGVWTNPQGERLLILDTTSFQLLDN